MPNGRNGIEIGFYAAIMAATPWRSFAADCYWLACVIIDWKWA